jgi:hypothetical protein
MTRFKTHKPAVDFAHPFIEFIWNEIITRKLSHAEIAKKAGAKFGICSGTEAMYALDFQLGPEFPCSTPRRLAKWKHDPNSIHARACNGRLCELLPAHFQSQRLGYDAVLTELDRVEALYNPDSGASVALQAMGLLPPNKEN